MKSITIRITVLAFSALVAIDPATAAFDGCAAEEPRIFADVPAENLFCPFIEELARRGAVAGCADGLFCPAETVTRAQLAAVVLQAQGNDPWGRISKAGNLLAGEGIAAVSHEIPGSGRYGLYIDRDISDCAFAATIREFDEPVIVTVYQPSRSPILAVTIYSLDGNRIDRSFDLVARCS